jgi:polyisoprenoid-binding protein YceI
MNRHVGYSSRISKVIYTALFLPAALALAAPASAQERVATLDPARTAVEFRLGATMHTVEGAARLESGKIQFDLQAGTATGEIIVDGRSLDTGNVKRDRVLHEKVLESEEHPRMVFRCQSIDGELPISGAGHVAISGSFEIHGEEHPLVLDFDVEVDGADLRATTAFTVPYVEWGMKDPSKFLLRVKKEVEVTIRAVGTLRASS